MKRFVYLIRDGDLYKIGASKDPDSRLPMVAISETAEMVHRFPSANAFQVENALHRRFSRVRAEDAPGREWFRLSDEDVELICALDAVDDVAGLPRGLRPKEEKSTLYAEIPAALKSRFEAVAERSGRKLNAELVYVLEAYCAIHERGSVKPE